MIDGFETTVMVDVAVPVQPAVDVPVTVYTVVAAGLPVTLLPVEPLNPAVQAYVLAPDALRVAVLPAQTMGELTVTVGLGDKVIFSVVVCEQPPALVTTRVYTPAPAAETPVTVGFCVVEEKLFGPVHVKPVPFELALNERLPPVQGVLLLTATVGVTPVPAIVTTCDWVYVVQAAENVSTQVYVPGACDVMLLVVCPPGCQE